MGGLADGDVAAAITASTMVAMFASLGRYPPRPRMSHALRSANARVFTRYEGKAGAVVVAALVEDGTTTIGWTGDARIYGLNRGAPPKLLTRDDTVAAEIERLEGPAPDAMNTLLRAIGTHPTLRPNTELLSDQYQSLLLVSDGVHRIEQSVFSWLHQCTSAPADLVKRLITASAWEGGIDNATALALQPSAALDEGMSRADLTTWIDVHPRTWDLASLRKSELYHDNYEPVQTAASAYSPSVRSTPSGEEVVDERGKKQRPRSSGRKEGGRRENRNESDDSRKPPQQPPLQIVFENAEAEKDENKT